VTEAGEPHPLFADTVISVSFEKREDGDVVRWHAACNTSAALVVVASDRIKMDDDIVSSAVLCPGPPQQQDDWLNGFFVSDPYWELEGDRLTLRTSSDVIELRRTTSDTPG
jgi:heat shock protein HslJ